MRTFLLSPVFCLLSSVFAFGFVNPRLQAQTAAKPTFEVASIKVSKLATGVRGSCHGVDSRYGPNAPVVPPLGRCVIVDGRLSHLIAIAYGLGSMQMLKGASDWVSAGDERFNVEAKAEDPKATEQQLLQMLQSLLEERFHMKYRRESKDVPGSALLVAKNGPKLQPSKSDTSGISMDGGKPRPGDPISIRARKYSIDQLARLLTQMGTPVQNKTGLDGEYDFTLFWDENAGPTLSTAVREQLGLQLESQKVPISLFVLESAQRPSEN